MPVQRRPRHEPAYYDELAADLARRIQRAGWRGEMLTLLERVLSRWEAADDHVGAVEHAAIDLPAINVPALVEATRQRPPGAIR